MVPSDPTSFILFSVFVEVIIPYIRTGDSIKSLPLSFGHDASLWRAEASAGTNLER